MKQPKESNIELNIEIIESNDDYLVDDEKLQRTDSWKQERSGNWTSSIKSKLMTCGQGTGKKSWNEKSKIYDFGKTALKAIYNAAMQRKTGRYIESGDGTKKMQYGTKVEPLIFAIAADMIAEKGILKGVGFKYFDDVPTAGVSVDGVLWNNLAEQKIIAVYEAKACTNWETHFDRTFDLMDEKGSDFWQTQDHMTAYNVNTCYYAVAEPPKDINKYIYYDGDIMDLLDEFRKECSITIQELEASPMHQNAGLKRIEIAEKIIEIWDSKGGDLRKIMYEVIEQFKCSHYNPDTTIGDKLLNESLPKIQPEDAFETNVKIHNELVKQIKETEVDPEDLPF